MNKESVDYELLNDIVKCIQEVFGFSNDAFETLSLATDINRELGIEGDDANELMLEFFERFSINIDKYDPYRYFVPEGYDFFSFRRSKDRRGKIPITLGMLYLAAKAKVWNTQELESVEFSPAQLYNCTSEIPLEGYKIHDK
ncbi:DUF1493 family protein [Pseudomonas syringae]|uniref:DUF1493 family protein n=1 Tax=Pseudomonas syringae pv. aptata TaxID=83167 RepID=A0A0Q0BXT6_PSEAP|nr:DUF1493 family protein [Pseudomonas syringae]KPZ01075.1 hypothetical protein ALO85_100641 [Pseudomonas syringae pv. aptata]MDP5163610.1 DUF1493 family protein [Pseudomonas syringae pv. aptata str. DSM 50252]RMO50360.1 hypothetical protein ALQ40_100666 [Pseudomonas syringae]RMO64690.1 hypothetical protein ALQ37_101013 [Pseudomonas syringae pv. aptata]